jgi:hypothetical protein
MVLKITNQKKFVKNAKTPKKLGGLQEMMGNVEKTPKKRADDCASPTNLGEEQEMLVKHQ